MKIMNEDKPIPIITVGKYAGTKIDALPNSYLRWMMTQDFPKEWLDCAKEKLEKSSYNNLDINVSRHTIDMFSKRFLSVWLQSESDKGEDADGLATFIAKLSQEAWEKGEDVSKYRHKDDGTVKLYKDIQWVFDVNPNYPDYCAVITVMPSIDK